MFIGIIAQSWEDCNQKVHITRLCLTEEECVQAIWQTFIEKQYFATTISEFLENISNQWDMDFIYNVHHVDYQEDHLYAHLCRRLFPIDMYARACTGEINMAEVNQHMMQQPMTREDIQNFIDELSPMSAHRLTTDCTFRVEEVLM